MAVATLSTSTSLTPPDFAVAPVVENLKIYGFGNTCDSDNNCLGHTCVLQAGGRLSCGVGSCVVVWEAVNMQAKGKTEKVCKTGRRQRTAKTTGRSARKSRNTWKLRREKLVLKKRQAIFNSRPGAPYNSTEYLITQYSSDTGKSVYPAAPCFYC